MDYPFVIGFTVLILFGLLMLTSASSVVSFQKFRTTYFYVLHQILYGFLPGTILLFIFSKVNYHWWRKMAFPLLVVSILSLVLVFVPVIGFGYGGSHRWLHLGAFLFQPSEMVKLTFLLYMAAWLSNRGEKGVKDFSYGFLPFIFLLGVVSLLIILQPDMGTMSVIVVTVAVMYIMAGAKLSHVGLMLGGAVAAGGILIKFASYRLARFMTFLHPELDPLGVGYHINQALLAVGSGGLFGRGYGHSRQKFAYLPEVMTDSIFAVISEELGFIFGVGLIALFIFLAWRGLKIAQRAPDQFGRLVATGIVTWITFQSFLNIGAMLSILPLTGIPLPFVSYGGSALLSSMIAIGILLNISRQGSVTT